MKHHNKKGRKKRSHWKKNSKVLALIGILMMSGVFYYKDLHREFKDALATIINLDPNQERSDSEAMPLYFIENLGQEHDDVSFTVRDGGADLFFTKDEAVYVMGVDESKVVYRQQFQNGSKKVELKGEHDTDARFSYLSGSEENWVQGAQGYRQIRYDELYPGIDLVFQGDDKALKYYYEVAPDANPSQIITKYQSQSASEVDQDVKLSIDTQGNLIVSTEHGQLTEKKPYVYQEIDGEEVKIDGSFKLLSDNQYTFELGDYEQDLPLIIDPFIEFGTYLGGSGNERPVEVLRDETLSNSIYIVGNTTSSDFPTAGTPFDGSFTGNEDAFVTKMAADGESLIWSTYIGGTALDNVDNATLGIDDADDNDPVYLVGRTFSSNFPTAGTPYDSTHSDPGVTSDAFVTILAADGQSLTASTFIGAVGNDYALGSGIALGESSSSVFVCGDTDNASYPTTPGVVRTTHTGGTDAVVTKLDSTLSNILISSYIGDGYCIAAKVNSSGDSGFGDEHVSVFGNTMDLLGTFPTDGVNYDDTHNGGWDAFWVKLDFDMDAYRYSTFYGGTADDILRDIRYIPEGVTLADHVFMVGNTLSSDLPVEDLQTTYGGGVVFGDGFLAHHRNAAASSARLQSATYFGGSDEDVIYGISDEQLSYFQSFSIVGGTQSSVAEGFPVGVGTPFYNYDPGSTMTGFVSWLRVPFQFSLAFEGSADNFSTYLGSTSAGEEVAIDVTSKDSSNDELSGVVVGYTNKSDFPTASFDDSYNGGEDVFVHQFGFFNEINFSGVAGPGDGEVTVTATSNLDAVLFGYPDFVVQYEPTSELPFNNGDFNGGYLDEGGINEDGDYLVEGLIPDIEYTFQPQTFVDDEGIITYTDFGPSFTATPGGPQPDPYIEIYIQEVEVDEGGSVSGISDGISGGGNDFTDSYTVSGNQFDARRYSFSRASNAATQTNTDYAFDNSLTSPTTVTFPASKDEFSEAIEIPFDFYLYNEYQDNFVIHSDGILAFPGPNGYVDVQDKTPPSTDLDVNTWTTGTDDYIVAGVCCKLDLESTPAGQPDGVVQYSVEGTAPLRRMVISFENVHLNFDDQAGNTFQIVLFESDITTGVPLTTRTLYGTPSDSTVDLEWDTPPSDQAITDFQIGYQEAPCTDPFAVNTMNTAGVVSTISIGGLTNGTEYCFGVKGISSVGIGGSSNLITRTPNVSDLMPPVGYLSLEGAGGGSGETLNNLIDFDAEAFDLNAHNTLAGDIPSGIATYQFSLDNETFSAPINVAPYTNGTDFGITGFDIADVTIGGTTAPGIKTVYMRLTDVAGNQNRSNWMVDSQAGWQGMDTLTNIDTTTTPGSVQLANTPGTLQTLSTSGTDTLPIAGTHVPVGSSNPPTHGGGAGVLGGMIYYLGGAESTGGGEPSNIVNIYDPGAAAGSRWSAGPNNHPAPTQGGMVETVGSNIYYYGGRTDGGDDGSITDAIHIFDGTNWSLGTAAGVNRAWSASAVVGTDIYYIGGKDDTTTDFDSVLKYDTLLDTWTIAGLTATPLGAFSKGIAETIGGRIYVTDSGANLASYDPVADTWDNTHPGPVNAAQYACSAVRDGELWMIGGYGSTNVESFDPAAGANGTWTTENSLNTARRDCASVVLGTDIFVIAGSDDDPGSVTGDVETLANTGGATWDNSGDNAIPESTCPALQQLNAVMQAGYTVLNGKIYVIGGHDQGGNSPCNVRDIVQVYDPAQVAGSRWSLADPLPATRYGIRATTVGNKIYAFGGRDQAQGSATNTMFIFEEGVGWITGTSHPTATADINFVLTNDGTDIWLADGADIYRYNVVLDTWTSGFTVNPDLGSAEEGGYIDGKIYIVDDDGETNEYTIATDSWRGFAQGLPDIPNDNSYARSIVINNKLYVIGGEGAETDIQSYDPTSGATGAWTAENSLAIGRRGPALGFLNNTLFAIGGGDDTPGDLIGSFDSGTFSAGGLATQGTVTSVVFDPEKGTDTDFYSIAWDKITPAGTDVQMEYRSCFNPDCSDGTFVGFDRSKITNSFPLSDVTDIRFQWRLTLNGDGVTSPVVESVNLNYDGTISDTINFTGSLDSGGSSVGRLSPSGNPPSDLATLVLGPTSVRYTWTDNSTNELGFKILDADSNELLTIAQNGVAATEEDLTPNTQYQGRALTSFNSAGQSSPLTFNPFVTHSEVPTPVPVTRTANSVTCGVSPDPNNVDIGDSGLLFELFLPATSTEVPEITDSDWVQSTTHVFQGVASHREVQCRVKARNQIAVETEFSPYLTIDPGTFTGVDYSLSLDLRQNDSPTLSEQIDPNSVLTGTIIVENTGDITGTNALLTMPIPRFVFVVPGSLAVDGVPQTDLADEDIGQVSPDTLSVVWPTLPANQEKVVSFQLTFDKPDLGVFKAESVLLEKFLEPSLIGRQDKLTIDEIQSIRRQIPDEEFELLKEFSFDQLIGTEKFFNKQRIERPVDTIETIKPIIQEPEFDPEIIGVEEAIPVAPTPKTEEQIFDDQEVEETFDNQETPDILDDILDAVKGGAFASAINPLINMQASVSSTETSTPVSSNTVSFEPDLTSVPVPDPFVPFVPEAEVPETPAPNPDPAPDPDPTPGPTPPPPPPPKPTVPPTPDEEEEIQETIEELTDPDDDDEDDSEIVTISQTDTKSFTLDIEDIAKGQNLLAITGIVELVGDQIEITGTASEPFTVIVLFLETITQVVVADSNGEWETLVDVARFEQPIFSIPVDAKTSVDGIQSDKVRIGQVNLITDQEKPVLSVRNDELIISTAIIKQLQNLVTANVPELQTTLTVIAPVVLVSSIPLWGYLPFIPTLLYNLFSFLLSATKRKRREEFHGTVYNSITKDPLPLAIIRIYDKETNKLVSTTVTDKFGRYTALINPGSYKLEVKKPQFSFPSHIVNGFADGVYENLYKEVGGWVVSGASSSIPDIPLDPIDAKKQFKLANAIKKVWYVLQAVGTRLALPTLVLGTIVSLVMTIAVPDRITNWIILTSYLIILVAQLRFALPVEKPWGIASVLSTKEPLPLTAIQLINTEFGKVVKSRLTDYQGRFSFSPLPGNYSVKATKGGYEQVFNRKSIPEQINIEKEGQRIKGDIVMKKQEGDVSRTFPQPLGNVAQANPVQPQESENE